MPFCLQTDQHAPTGSMFKPDAVLKALRTTHWFGGPVVFLYALDEDYSEEHAIEVAAAVGSANKFD